MYKLYILCKVFGHKMRFDSDNVAGPSTCKRKECLYKETGIKWPRERTKGIVN